MSEKHQSPIKTPQQLIVVVLVSFILPVAVIVLLTQLFTGGLEKGANTNQDAVLTRIKPVGDVVLAEAAGPKGQATGEQVYGQVCKTCHEPGIAGAHQVGDKGAWAKVIAQGPAVTLKHAISGLRAMPPRGGNPDLTDAEVERAVVFMVNRSGGNWKEPPAPAAAAMATAAPSSTAATAPPASRPAAPAPAAGASPSAAPPAPAPATVAAAAAPAASRSTAASATKPDGKKIYDTVCAVCHGAGVAGAPKPGDKAAWAPRIKAGMDAVHANALKGKGAMPPKGGNAALSDAEVAAAVDYMVAGVK